MDKIATALKLVPAIIAAIKAIEDAIPGTGKGEQKLAAIREVIEQADEAAAKVWPLVSGIVATLVRLFNATGVFRKDAA